jgi:hypothetical protein
MQMQEAVEGAPPAMGALYSHTLEGRLDAAAGACRRGKWWAPVFAIVLIAYKRLPQ